MPEYSKESRPYLVGQNKSTNEHFSGTAWDNETGGWRTQVHWGFKGYQKNSTHPFFDVGI